MRTYILHVSVIQYPIEMYKNVQAENWREPINFENSTIRILIPYVHWFVGRVKNTNFTETKEVAGANLIDTIPNPGFRISAIDKKRVNTYTYTYMIYSMIGRNINIINMERARLQNMKPTGLSVMNTNTQISY